MPLIIYDEGDGKVKSVALKKNAQLVIGRGSDNAIVIHSPKASREHCVIYYYSEGGCFALHDLGSTNGTCLNGYKISGDVILAGGDIISVGDVKFRFVSDEPVARPLAGKPGAQKEIKKAEPVKAFDLEDLVGLDHTQSLRIPTDSEVIKLPFGVQEELAFSEGVKIGENVVLRRVSDSQMASVFIVKSPLADGDGEAALKIFKKQVGGGKAEEEFLAAVQEASRIAHPGFLKYLEGGVHEGRCYYVADLMEKPNLARKISRKAPFPEEECLETARAIGASLSYAFASFNSVHRNLKPSNILFSKDDSPIVADYGLAVWESKYLAERVSIASPWYISPEQVNGRRIGWTSDLYSLGVIFFQMLTGVLPFHASTEEDILGMHLELPFPAPSDRNPNVNVSQGSIALLASMTAKDPAARFESWADFLASVDGVLSELRDGAKKRKPYRPEKTGVPQKSEPPAPKTNSVKRRKLIFRTKK